MPTFDGENKTKTRVPLDHDAFQPDMGMLVGSGNTEEARVNGTQKIEVKGATTWNHRSTLAFTVDGAVTENFNNDFTYSILGKTDGTHVSDAHYLYVSQRSDNQMSSHITMNIGPKTSTFIAPLTENHSSPRTINEPAAKIDFCFMKSSIGASQNTVYGYVGTIAATLMQAAGAQVQAAGMNIQPSAVNAQVNGAAIGLNLFNLSQDITKVETEALKVFCETGAGAKAKAASNPGGISN